MTRRYAQSDPDENTADSNIASGFVADGYERLVDGVESEARHIVESKYAEEWNASGIMRRWQLQRMIDAEITEIVAKTMPDVSPDALF